MNVYYSDETDVLHIQLRGDPLMVLQSIAPGITLEMNRYGETIGIEIKQASHRLHEPREVIFTRRERLSSKSKTTATDAASAETTR